MRELWKAVIGFEDRYEVSNLGRLRNAQGLMLKLQSDKDGYQIYTMSKKGIKWTTKIHRLVQAQFSFRPYNYPFGINHKDDNKTNNCFSNLEYLTAKQNAQHAVANGLMPCGEKSTSAKLTERQVRNIRAQAALGNMQKYIAQQYKISHQQISKIVKGQRWKHLYVCT